VTAIIFEGKELLTSEAIVLNNWNKQVIRAKKLNKTCYMDTNYINIEKKIRRLKILENSLFVILVLMILFFFLLVLPSN